MADFVNTDNSIVFCDFDGTITKNDTVNYFLSLFADKKWLEIEEQWIKGEIGSKECMTRQFNCIDYISQEQLDNFIENIEIDEYFVEFVEFLKKNNTEVYIVSDGFDLFINSTLKKYNLDDIKVFSNKLIFDNGKFITSYPRYQIGCKKNAGLCKCEVIESHRENKRVIYIGDGNSDVCVCSLADTLFAKNELSVYCCVNSIAHIKFSIFKDICSYLDSGEYENAENKILIRQGN